MDNFTSRFAGILVAFLGLVYTSNLWAQSSPSVTSTSSYATSEEALTACLVLQAQTSSAVSGAYAGRYVDLTFTYPCSLGTLGTSTNYPNSYACGASVRDTTNNSTQYVSCTNSSVPAIRSTPRVVVFRFAGEPPSNQCENLSPFQTRTLRAPTPNGSGDVCYNGCSWSVGIGYVGTYPAGYLEYDFISNGRECNPDESEPVDTTEEPIDTDEPLDLDPDQGGVDNNTPDPGSGRDENGNGSSSGGGSCDAPPACTGESIQCNILFQTWSTRCAVTNLGDSGNGENGDNPWDGKTQEPGDTNVSQLISDEVIDGADFLDSSGMGLSRSCPQLDNFSLNIFGSVVEIDFMSRFCGATSWLGPFMVLLGSYLGILAFLRAR